MTDPAIDGAPEPSFSQSNLTAGRRLAAARESLGLSVADVARQIKLSVHQVEALEADDLGRLPKSPVIVKGFLRNYAKLVQIDPEQLLGNVHGIPSASDEVPGEYRRREVVTFDRPSRPWLKAILGVLLIVAILLGVYEYQMNPDFFGEPAAPQAGDRRATATPSRPPQAPPAAQLSPAAAEQPAPLAATVEGPGTPVAPPLVAETGATAPASAAVAGDLPPTAAAASGQGIVRFRFERDAWIEIKDRDGNRIMNQLGKAGTEKSVQGIPPLQLVVGAASGVKVDWNDQPVNIVPFTKVDVARFTLE